VKQVLTTLSVISTLATISLSDTAACSSSGLVLEFGVAVTGHILGGAALKKLGEFAESNPPIVHSGGVRTRTHKGRTHRRVRKTATTFSKSTNRNATVALNPQPLPPRRVPTTGINRNAKTRQ